MDRLLVGWWIAVWPNLAANVIWIPVVAVSHRLTKQHIARKGLQEQAHAERRHQEILAHISSLIGSED